MCNLGRHRTGTVVGCLRKLQRWNLASIFEEYRRHAGARVKVMNEQVYLQTACYSSRCLLNILTLLQFIELFDADIVNIPAYPAAQRSLLNGIDAGT